MKFFKRKATFYVDETGAVTVDWVVLTAAIVGLGVAVLQMISPGADRTTRRIRNYMVSLEVKTTF